MRLAFNDQELAFQKEVRDWITANMPVEVAEESRRSRMRQGALSWELLHDLYDPGRFVEQITDESWTEHLRRFDRVTADDVSLRDRKLTFHIADAPPLVTRTVIEAS